MPLISKLKEVELSRKEPGLLKGPGSKGDSEIDKNIYKIKMEKRLDSIDALEDNLTKMYSVVWVQCTDELQQGLCRHEYFDDKDIESDAKWLLK